MAAFCPISKAQFSASLLFSTLSIYYKICEFSFKTWNFTNQSHIFSSFFLLLAINVKLSFASVFQFKMQIVQQLLGLAKNSFMCLGIWVFSVPNFVPTNCKVLKRYYIRLTFLLIGAFFFRVCHLHSLIFFQIYDLPTST